jgi:hypothetical protein
MPIHDWTRVKAGIFHHFHHDWITEIARVLNRGILPGDYYALADQFASGFGPDVLTPQGRDLNGAASGPGGRAPNSGGGVKLAPPKLRPTAETEMEFHRRKQKVVSIRHVSDDKIVAMIEVVSPGNKDSRNPFRTFVEKAAQLIANGVHLLILDLFPPGPRDPQGIHAGIWDEVAGQPYVLPPDKPLTLAAYECALAIRAYVVQCAVGDVLSDMPLFLEPGLAVEAPLEATYNAAFAEVPRRWRSVLDTPAP